MPGLAEQRLIICELEQTTAIHRVRLSEACRLIQPSAETTDKVMRPVGTALIAAEMAPLITAVNKALLKGQTPGEQRRRLIQVFLETPRLLRTLRRLRP